MPSFPIIFSTISVPGYPFFQNGRLEHKQVILLDQQELVFLKCLNKKY